MKNCHWNSLLIALLLAPLAGLSAADGSADGLVIYPPVSGLAASEHYAVRVRAATLAGMPVHGWEFFKTNEFVDWLIFATRTGFKP